MPIQLAQVINITTLVHPNTISQIKSDYNATTCRTNPNIF